MAVCAHLRPQDSLLSSNRRFRVFAGAGCWGAGSLQRSLVSMMGVVLRRYKKRKRLSFVADKKAPLSRTRGKHPFHESDCSALVFFLVQRFLAGYYTES
jgi:hypothetical protein